MEARELPTLPLVHQVVCEWERGGRETRVRLRVGLTTRQYPSHALVEYFFLPRYTNTGTLDIKLTTLSGWFVSDRPARAIAI